MKTIIYIIKIAVVIFITFPLHGSTPYFTVLLIPDTQHYTERSNDNTYKSQMNWIISNYEKENIKVVIHLGDVRNDDSDDQFKVARKAHELLEKHKIPYIIAPGNHDWDENLFNEKNGEYGAYNEYFKRTILSNLFPNQYFTRSNNNNNAYFIFDVDKIGSKKINPLKFLVISLENAPDLNTLCWAGEIIKKYPDRRVIIATHTYQKHTGEYMGYSAPHGDRNSSEMFSNLIKMHKNIFFVTCGHACGIYNNVKTGVYNNTINELLVDFQCEEMNNKDHGNGWMSCLRFYPERDSIAVSFFSSLSGVTQTNNTADDNKIIKGYSFTYNMNNQIPDYHYPVPFTHDFLINTKRNGEQTVSDIAMAKDESFAVVWQDDCDNNDVYQIYAAGFNSNSTKKWGDITVNKNSAGQQKNPTIGMAHDGSFVVVWEDDNDKNDFYQIYAAGFNSNGTKRWGDITVNKKSDGQQKNPAIAMAGNGSFVVAWEDDNNKNNVYQIYAAGFNADGSKRWGDITVNKNSDGQQKNPTIAITDDGYFVVSWQDDNNKNEIYQICAAGFNSNGTKRWGDITVNKNSAGQQKNPAVAIADDGYFVVSWQDDNNNNNIYQIYAAGFNSNGTKRWGDKVVNSTPCGQQINPSVKISSNGYSYLAWNDNYESIQCTSFDKLGVKQFEDYKVNQTSYANQYWPKITTHNESNRIAVVWVKSSSDKYETDMYGRVLNMNTKLDQTINFHSLPSRYLGDASFDLSGSSSSGLAVTYSSSNANVATIVGNRVTIVGTGSTDIKASQPGNDIYNPASSVIQTLTVKKANQIITFSPLLSKTYGDADFYLTGSASSGLTVTYNSSNTNVATLAGNKVTIVGAGSTNITAQQPGNDNYNPSNSVIQPFTVKKADQIITFGPLSSKTYGDADFYLTGSASSGLFVTYNSSNTNVATLAGNKVTITGIGSTDITALQPGNFNYNPAASVTQSLTVLQVTAINEKSLQKLIVYPNPTTGQIFVQSEQVMEYVDVYDLPGNQLGHYQLNSNSTTIDLSQFSSAVYIIKVKCGKTEYNRMIIKN